MLALLMVRLKDDPECRFLILAGLSLKGFGPNWSVSHNGICIAYGEST
jgi:hypothetical protein